MSWFKPKTFTRFQVVELEKPAPRLSLEDSSNIASLANHPGFHALVGRLKLQRAGLESVLRSAAASGNHLAAQEAAIGINWISWLDKQVQLQVGKKPIEARDAFELEDREFRRMAEALEFVGKG